LYRGGGEEKDGFPPPSWVWGDFEKGKKRREGGGAPASTFSMLLEMGGKEGGEKARLLRPLSWQREGKNREGEKGGRGKRRGKKEDRFLSLFFEGGKGSNFLSPPEKASCSWGGGGIVYILKKLQKKKGGILLLKGGRGGRTRGGGWGWLYISSQKNHFPKGGGKTGGGEVSYARVSLPVKESRVEAVLS